MHNTKAFKYVVLLVCLFLSQRLNNKVLPDISFFSWIIHFRERSVELQLTHCGLPGVTQSFKDDFVPWQRGVIPLDRGAMWIL